MDQLRKYCDIFKLSIDNPSSNSE